MRNSYFDIADRNLKTAKHLLDVCDYNESVRYCQQYVEKVLKGYIETYGETEDLKLLSLYYDNNCPGESFMEVVEEDAKTCY